ncbi:cystatin-like [Neosynchiropus ocellatus]
MFCLGFVLVCVWTLPAAAAPGGPGFPYDVEIDGKILSTARFAVREFNKANNDPLHYTLLEIQSAKAQVVAGINYILEVKLARTSCPKRNTGGESCVLKLGMNENLMFEEFQCHFVVLEALWEDSRSLTEMNCNPLLR